MNSSNTPMSAAVDDRDNRVISERFGSMNAKDDSGKLISVRSSLDLV